MRISALGYADAHEVVLLTVEKPRAVMNVALEPLRDATLQATVQYEHGGWFEGSDLLLEYAQSQGGQRGTAVLDGVGNGVFESEIPPGEWFVRIRPVGPLGVKMAWRGEVQAHPDSVARVNVRIPRGGSLRIHTREELGECSAILKGPDISSRAALSETVTEWPNMPAGGWHVTIRCDGRTVLDQEIAIRAGLVTEVRVP